MHPRRELSDHYVNSTPVSPDMGAASIIWAVYVKINPNSAIIFKRATWLSPLVALFLYAALTDCHSAIFVSEEGRLHSTSYRPLA